jgi:hypothetical protein
MSVSGDPVSPLDAAAIERCIAAIVPSTVPSQSTLSEPTERVARQREP